jgi:glycosyltransferase involved in cell wall biosynthesis
LIPAVTTLLRNHPTLTFTVAGCGPTDVKADFPEDLRSRIEVIPRINGQQELIAVYQRHSVFVLPSMFEGQPLVMSEAAASGLAVVTTSCCGMLDFIRDGENGLLVQPGDATALAGALDRLFRDDALTARLAVAGRETAREFTWERSASQMLAAYQAAVVIGKTS